jgi:branched-chain amino acid transport system substrate-binding protein
LSELGPAWQAYFDYVNEKGGVNGRDIKVKYYDDAYNPTQSSQVVRKLVQQDKVFAILGGVGTPTHAAVIDFLNANRVPDVFVTSGSGSFNQPDDYPMMFGWQPTIVTEAKLIAQQVSTKYPDKKVCLFGQDGEFGDQGQKGVEEVLGDDALAKVANFTPSDPAIDPQMMSLKSAGCEVITYFGISAFASLALTAADKINYHPVLVGTSSNTDYLALAGSIDNPELLEGFETAVFRPAPQDAENSWNKLFQDVWKQYGNGKPYGSFVQYGMSQAYTAVQALQKAGKDLTRESFVKAIEANDFAPNPGLVPFNYAADNHSGYSGGAFAVVRKGVFVTEGDIYTTQEGADEPIEAYSEPASVAPAGGLPPQ